MSIENVKTVELSSNKTHYLKIMSFVQNQFERKESVNNHYYLLRTKEKYYLLIEN